MHDERVQILLIEEEPVLADITAFRLELLGYVVSVEGSAEEALRRLDAHTPDLIIVDASLPDTSGIELVNRLSSDARTADTPILLFSANADLDAVERAHAAGASDYLVTPYDPAVLEKKVETLVRDKASV